MKEKSAETKELSAILRSHRPTSLLVHVLNESEPKTIGIPGDSKRRFHRTAKLLSQLDWTRIEGYDADGNLVMAEDSENEEIEEPEEERFEEVPVENRDAQLLRILTAAQSMVLERFETMFIGLINGYQDHMNLVLERVSQLEAHYADTLKAMREAAETGQSSPMDLAGMVLQGAMARKIGGGNDTSGGGLTKFLEKLPPEQLQGIISAFSGQTENKEKPE